MNNDTRQLGAPQRRGVLAAAAIIIVALVSMAAPATTRAKDVPPTSGDASVIWEWNNTAMNVLTPSGRPVVTQPFVVADMHVAMYDAVMAIEQYAEPFATSISASPDASVEAAAATAAHRVLVGLLPDSANVFDAALVASLAEIPDGESKTDGIAVGEAAGWATLAYRQHDGSQSGPLPEMLPEGPGVWKPTPPATVGLAPWLGTAEPFTMRSVDQFRPAPPPALDSARYRRAVDEVRRVGGSNSTERTAQETEIARFWADQPIAQGQRALRAKAQALGWGIAPTARLFAAAMTSQADAIIACWDAKFAYQLWRPWQSVPVVEPGWTPLLGTPNHPEFPSAHGCVTGSLARAIAHVMQTRRIDLDIDAVNIGVTRHYDTIEQLLAEVGNARVWGGLHYRFSVEAGLHIGEQVVRHNLRHNFRQT